MIAFATASAHSRVQKSDTLLIVSTIACASCLWCYCSMNDDQWCVH